MNNNTKPNIIEKIATKTPLEIATEYFLKGWQPIPIPTRSKNPNFPGWHLQHTNGGSLKNHPENNLSERFHGSNGKPQNIGVLLGEPSNFLVDIDLDQKWSVQLPPYFLPETNAVFGRKSKRRSHYLYYCPEAKTEKFQFTEMIIEFRSTGMQTVFPGSIHESGEPVTWDVDGEPSEVSFQELRSAVGKLAAASLLSELWVDSKMT